MVNRTQKKRNYASQLEGLWAKFQQCLSINLGRSYSNLFLLQHQPEVKFTAEGLRSIMDRKHNIRNISVIAQDNHGKSTLTDSLVAAAGIIAQEVAGDVGITDEAERGITIESPGISLYYEMPDEALKHYKGKRDGNEYLINLIDSPGHVDFPSDKLRADLRITDGALVVVDCMEGVSVQTRTVLSQALEERIRPVLTIDNCFLQLQVDGEEAYTTFEKVIENANVIMATCEDFFHDVRVYPEKGTVAFSAGLHGRAFTLSYFAKMHASKFGVDEFKMMERLWGENFFDPATKKWTTKSTGSPTCRRGFVQYCYEPIRQVIDTCMNDKEKLWPMLTALGVQLKNEEKNLFGEALMKRVMQTWLPASSALLEMMIYHLPAPATAQRYRVTKLYEGPMDDDYSTAIRNCDPKGPLMLYVSQMIPASDKGGFFAFGRVFAGEVRTGRKVRIMGPNFPGDGKDLHFRKILSTLILMGKRQESVAMVPCGNILMLDLGQLSTENATITYVKDVTAHPIRNSVVDLPPLCPMNSPVVRVAVQREVELDLPKLIEGLKCLSESDPMVVGSIDSGEHTIARACKCHVEINLKNIKKPGVSLVQYYTDGSYTITAHTPQNPILQCVYTNTESFYMVNSKVIPKPTPEHHLRFTHHFTHVVGQDNFMGDFDRKKSLVNTTLDSISVCLRNDEDSKDWRDLESQKHVPNASIMSQEDYEGFIVKSYRKLRIETLLSRARARLLQQENSRPHPDFPEVVLAPISDIIDAIQVEIGGSQFPYFQFQEILGKTIDGQQECTFTLYQIRLFMDLDLNGQRIETTSNIPSGQSNGIGAL